MLPNKIKNELSSFITSNGNYLNKYGFRLRNCTITTFKNEIDATVVQCDLKLKIGEYYCSHIFNITNNLAHEQAIIGNSFNSIHNVLVGTEQIEIRGSNHDQTNCLCSKTVKIPPNSEKIIFAKSASNTIKMFRTVIFEPNQLNGNVLMARSINKTNESNHSV